MESVTEGCAIIIMAYLELLCVFGGGEENKRGHLQNEDVLAHITEALATHRVIEWPGCLSG